MDSPTNEIDRELLDNIGPWTRRKHEIVQYYAQAYSRILTRTKRDLPFKHVYIDGFAGAGIAIDRSSGRLVQGSALLVLGVRPPFDRYIFVELDNKRAAILERGCRGHSVASVIVGDANAVLPNEVLPTIRYERFERAFCLLDPYKLDALRWETILAAAMARTIDLLIHFPVMDINRSCPRDGNVKPSDAGRLLRYWGDETWKSSVYSDEGLLPFANMRVKASNSAICGAFCKRLRTGAGFRVVEGPIPMRNSINRTIYDLIFASNNLAARRPMRDTVQRFGDGEKKKTSEADAPCQTEMKLDNPKS